MYIVLCGSNAKLGDGCGWVGVFGFLVVRSSRISCGGRWFVESIISQVCLFLLWHGPAILTAHSDGSPFKGMDQLRILPVDILGD